MGVGKEVLASHPEIFGTKSFNEFWMAVPSFLIYRLSERSNLKGKDKFELCERATNRFWLSSIVGKDCRSRPHPQISPSWICGTLCALRRQGFQGEDDFSNSRANQL